MIIWLILFPPSSNLLSLYHLYGSKSIGMLQNHWKKSCSWEKLKAGEGDDRGWDGWMGSSTQWTWVWVNSRIWCCSPWVRRVGHDWVTELNWTKSLGQRKSQAGRVGKSCSKDPNTWWFSGYFFKGKIWGEGYKMYDSFWLLLPRWLSDKESSCQLQETQEI